MEAEQEPDDGEGSGVAASYFNIIPEDCIAKVISFTTPCDAVRLSLVFKSFKSAADSNAAWERFLPPDYRTLVSPITVDWPKKVLYLNICDQPIMIEEGKKSLSMEKKTGKKCYMLSPRDLTIIWVDNPLYWDWISVPGSRLPDIAELLNVCWLEIRGTINTQILSAETLYGAYFVFKYALTTYGFENQEIEVAVGLVGGPSIKRTVFLDYQDRNSRPSCTIRRGRPLNRMVSFSSSRGDNSDVKERVDGWFEVTLIHYVPNPALNLVSVSQLCKSGHWVLFSSSVCLIRDHRTQNVIGIGRIFVDFYVLDELKVIDIDASSID